MRPEDGSGRLDLYRSRSLWLDRLADEEPITPRAPLDGPLEVDVAVVGAGYTGLWTAYYLRRADPGLRIAVVERYVAGFGASGRNGGWCSGFMPTGHERLARRAGREATVALQRELYRTIDEVGRVAREEGIDCHWVKGGTLHLATSPLQARRGRAEVEGARDWGIGPDDLEWLDAAAARRRIQADGVLGAAWSPHCAAIDPARLARGLARVVERLGVPVFEETPALALRPGVVETPRGRLRAEVVVRATEAWTATLPGSRRLLVPLYSLMIATEPLPPGDWEAIGWAGHETVDAGGNLFVYAQRTRDGRIAFGGRGAPYHFGSTVRPAYDRHAGVHERLRATLAKLLPQVGEARVTHRWGGPLGLPRDWTPSIGLDRASGLAWAGGYVGDGVAAANLAGRTLADLVTGADSELTRLPWVGHRSPRWEPEPLRWLGINGVRLLAGSADAAEERSGRPARLRGRVLARLAGG
jgi:glycine/D-amino acid oxidase-like deaminating enzyme